MIDAVELVEQIASRLLYDGAIVWPYRTRAIHQRKGAIFGGIFPTAHAEASGGVDRATVCAEVFCETSSPTARIDATLRFLHRVDRQASEVDWVGNHTPVQSLDVGDAHLLSWEEATERVVKASVTIGETETATVKIAIPAGVNAEMLRSAEGEVVGAIVRSWGAIDATMAIEVAPVSEMLPLSDAARYRVAVTITNSSAWRGSSDGREDALRHTLCAAHVVLHGEAVDFLSTETPPPEWREITESLCNEGLWPSLIGDSGDRHTLLASPIILGDYPSLPLESSAEVFDGGEPDQLLVLNVLSMTEVEQDEQAAADARARDILARCEKLEPQEMQHLHPHLRLEQPMDSTQIDSFNEERS